MNSGPSEAVETHHERLALLSRAAAPVWALSRDPVERRAMSSELDAIEAILGRPVPLGVPFEGEREQALHRARETWRSMPQVLVALSSQMAATDAAIASTRAPTRAA